jgi:hypothetical protein
MKKYISNARLAPSGSFDIVSAMHLRTSVESQESVIHRSLSIRVEDWDGSKKPAGSNRQVLL